MPKFMIVGDSITEGSSGDYTWRYRLWKHLKASQVAGIQFVGPRHGLDDLTETGANEDSEQYADPDFDEHHLALWGQPFTAVMENIGQYVRDCDPDVVLTLLGINDFVWYGETAFQVEQDVRIYIAEARRQKPTLGFTFGRLLPTQRAAGDPEFAGIVADFNARLEALAAELSLPFSPVVVASDDDGFDPYLHTWDGTHPNSHGEVRIAAAFADALALKFGLGSPYPRPLPEVTDVPKAPPAAA